MTELFYIIGLHLANVFALSMLCKLGWKALGFGVLANMLLIPVVANKQIELFGYITNAGNIPYAAIIFGLTVLAIRYDFRGVLKIVNATYIALLIFLILGKLLANMPIVAGNEEASRLTRLAFSSLGQITVASFFAFYATATVNTLIMYQERIQNLWTRKIVANIAAQITDSAIFFPIAFAGTWDWSMIFTAMVAGMVVKSLLNILETPFLSLAMYMHKQSNDEY